MLFFFPSSRPVKELVLIDIMKMFYQKRYHENVDALSIGSVLVWHLAVYFHRQSIANNVLESAINDFFVWMSNRNTV